MMLCIIITDVKKYDEDILFVTVWSHISLSQITQTCDTEKVVKDSGTSNII